MKKIIIATLILFFSKAINAQLVYDASFNNSINTSNKTIRAIAVQRDQKIIIAGEGGNPSVYGSIPYDFIARLNADGTYDASFHTLNNLTSSGNHISAIAIEPWSDNIIIGGEFDRINGHVVGHIARLDKDGNFDASFNPGGVGINRIGCCDLNVYAILVKDNPNPLLRRIIVCGTFDNYNNASPATGPLVQLLDVGDGLGNDGKRDNSFDPQVSGGGILCMAIDKIGRLLIGGDFDNIQGKDVKRIARFTPAGVLDNTFLAGWYAPDSYVTGMGIDPVSNKLIIGGDFTNYIDDKFIFHPAGHLARINEDRSLDASFNTSVGFSCVGVCEPNTDAKNILFTKNGDVLVSGRFAYYNGVETKNIILLQQDGTIDPLYIPASGFSDYVYAMALQYPGGATDERVIGAGTTNSFDPFYNSATTSFKQGTIMRLVTTPTILPLHITDFKANTYKDSVMLSWEIGEKGNDCFIIERSYNGINFSQVSTVCSTDKIKFQFTDQPSANGKVYYRLEEYENGRRIGISATRVIDFSTQGNSSYIIFPNPAKDCFYLKGNFGNDQLKVNCYNALGVLLLQKQLLVRNGNNSYKIDISSINDTNVWIQVMDQSGKSIIHQQLFVDKKIH